MKEVVVSPSEFWLDAMVVVVYLLKWNLYFLFFSIFWNIDFTYEINASKNWWAAKATAQFFNDTRRSIIKKLVGSQGNSSIFYKQIYRYKFVSEKSPPTEKVPLLRLPRTRRLLLLPARTRLLVLLPIRLLTLFRAVNSGLAA
jgi:hypothetical protein